MTASDSNTSAASGQYAVSVIVPAHNVAPYLRRCVKSLLDQTLGDRLEILLIENGSTDSTPAVCRELAALHPNVRALVSPTVGPGNARNFGLRHATGKYIGFIDGDDHIAPSMYEELIDAIETTEADTSWCNFRFDYTEAAQIPSGTTPPSDTGRTPVFSSADAAFDIITDRATSSICTRLFRRSFFNSHLFPENQLYEDHAVMFRWIADCHKAAHIDRALYYYCLRAGSTTQSSPDIRRQANLMTAQLGRLKFIDSYRAFTPEQTRKARNIALKYAIYILKSYIYQTDDTPGERQSAMQLREMLLDACSYTTRDIKFSLWFRMLRIKHAWNGYYRHLARKKNT
ncbi:MAG: glycosyltransferase [Muribaculaceae bacterium]|nr:glycosyltransferase [Muribaculaceae bacterium]